MYIGKCPPHSVPVKVSTLRRCALLQECLAHDAINHICRRDGRCKRFRPKHCTRCVRTTLSAETHTWRVLRTSPAWPWPEVEQEDRPTRRNTPPLALLRSPTAAPPLVLHVRVHRKDYTSELGVFPPWRLTLACSMLCQNVYYVHTRMTPLSKLRRSCDSSTGEALAFARALSSASIA